MKHRVLISPADSKLIENLNALGVDCYSAMRLDGVPLNEQCHADMQVLRIHDTVFVAECFYEQYGSYVADGLRVFSVRVPSGKYPDNVSLNAAYAGGRLFCKVSSLDNAVKEFCNSHDIDIINVNQGYSKCSTLVIGENAIITADSSIAKAALKCDVDVLLISPGNIRLEGADYGFIGGASGVIGKTVYFFGDIELHPDSDSITAFIKRHNYNYTSVGGWPLVDVGGFINLDK